jgi:hypothetical protein
MPRPSTPEERARQAREQLRLLQEHGSATYREGAFAQSNSCLEFVTAREFAAQTPATTEWVVEPFVPLGGVTKIDGAPKRSGKTTFICHMVAAILTGSPFLGKPTKRGSVVMLSEQGGSSLREALAGAGLLDADDFHITTIGRTARHEWPDVVKEAVAFCVSKSTVLLIVDTLTAVARVRGDDENSSGRALEVLEPLLIAADEHKIGVIGSFHDRKSGGEVGESGRGSSAYAGGVDVIIQITKPGGNFKPTIRKLAAESRYSATPDELFIELTDTGYVSLGTAGDVARVAVTAALADTLPTTEDGAVTINGVKKDGEIVERGLHEELGAKGVTASRPTLEKEVNRWADAGYVGKTGAGKKGSPFRYWLIAAPPADFLSANAQTPFAQHISSRGDADTEHPVGSVDDREIDCANGPSLIGAESNHDADAGAEKVSAATQGAPAESNGHDAYEAEKLSAATPILKAAERNDTDGFGDLFGAVVAECRGCGGSVDNGQAFCFDCDSR